MLIIVVVVAVLFLAPWVLILSAETIGIWRDILDEVREVKWRN